MRPDMSKVLVERPPDGTLHRSRAAAVRSPALGRQGQHRATAVVLVARTLDQFRQLEPGDDPGQRSGIEVEPLRQFSSRNTRVAADEHQRQPLRPRQSNRCHHPLGDTLQFVVDFPHQSHEIDDRIDFDIPPERCS